MDPVETCQGRFNGYHFGRLFTYTSVLNGSDMEH